MAIVRTMAALDREALVAMSPTADRYHETADAEALTEIYRRTAVWLPCPDTGWPGRP